MMQSKASKAAIRFMGFSAPFFGDEAAIVDLL
jgi:hypothetical protein